MKPLLASYLCLGLAAAATAASHAQGPFPDPNPGETDRQTLKRILVDNPYGPFTDPNPGEGVSATLKRILIKPAPSSTPPPVGTAAGTYAAGNDPRLTGADRGEAFAHLFANAGTGTEASPFTSTDGTAGIAPALASLPRGGTITLAAGRFDVATAPVISTPGTCIRGLALGANVDPNGESEGVNGTKIHASGDGFIVQVASGSTARIQGLSFEHLYIWGSGKSGFGGSAGITVSAASLDQPHFTDINVGNAGAAIQVAYVPGTGQLDTPYFTRINALHCSFGLLFCGPSTIYAHVTDCCFSDLDNAGIVDSNSGGDSTYTGLTLVRCAGYGDAAVRLRSPNNHLLNSHVSLTGQRGSSSGHNAAADGISLEAGGNVVANCLIDTTVYGSGIRVTNNAAGCVIRGNQFASNTTDITIDAGCADTVVDESGQRLVIVDNGTRTIINGQGRNAGDPDTGSAWNGHAKPDGLQIIDTTTGDVWLYSSALTGGRKKL